MRINNAPLVSKYVPRVGTVCSYLCSGQVTAAGGKTSPRGSQALSEDKLWSALHLRRIALGCVTIWQSTSYNRPRQLTLDGGGG